jgi:SAM-dependent methyltransferase
MDSTNIERLQRLHFEAIGSRYQTHYGDPQSQQYRNRFIYEPMFTGIDLSGRNVLEAMCGNGQTTQYLISKGARVTGLDLADAEIGSFRQRWPNCDAHCASIFDSGLPDSSFDCVAIVGGLHHLHPNLSHAVYEVHRLLRPGGYFCFAEPYKGSFPDAIRTFWYKHDNLFASNEASIDLNALETLFSSQFNIQKRMFLGNIGYLFVLNSMIFRLPVRLKRLYSPTLMRIESVINKFQGERLSCFVVSQWQKR